MISTIAEHRAGDGLPEIDRARVAAAMSRVRALFDPSAGGSRQIVIFGTGHLGRKILTCARAAGLDVLAATDNDERRWNSLVDGIPVVSPAEALATCGSATTFVIGIFNPRAVSEQLRGAGCRRIANYPEFFWNFADSYTAMSGLATPDLLIEREAEIHEAFGLLADDASRREFAAQVAWRCSLDDSLLAPPSPYSDMYYDRNIYTMSAYETFVDCGGFDGDSLRTFLKRTDGRFGRAYVLEPDPANRAKLASSLERLAASDRAKVEILPYAVSDRNGTVHFDPDHGPGSTANETGSLEVACRRLDDVIPVKPTLIKIDIEGAEPFALRGAARTIREARPVIAIVAYHYSEHLWELPKLLHELAPDAKLYFRRHADHCWETIYYAVPPERCVPT